MDIRIGSIADIPMIRRIADRTWRESFRAVIPMQQVDYMLDKMYSQETLEFLITEGRQVFLMGYDHDDCVGFAAYEVNADGSNITRLHKLFVLPDMHKTGAGTLLLEEVVRIARSAGNEAIHLNVNRQNPAVEFYLSKGFEVLEEDDISIGGGFVLKDYIMALKLDQRGR